MNIVFFNTNIAWGGGEKWHFKMAENLRKSSYSTSIYAHPDSILRKKSLQAGIPCRTIRISNLSFLNPFKIYSLVRQFRKMKIDCLVLNLSSDVKIAGLAAKMAGIPKVIYRRGMALPVSNSLINRYVFRKVLTAIVVNSKDIGTKLNAKNPSLISSDKVHVIYNGVNLSDYEALNVPNNEPLILGNAGRLVEQKGQKYLIGLADRLKRQNIKFRILIAGTGALESELKQLAKDKGVESSIEFLGFVEDMKSYLEKIDIFLLPSLHEGSSNVLIEAMACGKPAITFNISSMPEMVEHGRNGFLVQFDDMDDYAARCVELIKDENKRNRYGEESNTIVREKFTFDRTIKEFIQLIS